MKKNLLVLSICMLLAFIGLIQVSQDIALAEESIHVDSKAGGSKIIKTPSDRDQADRQMLDVTGDVITIFVEDPLQDGVVEDPLQDQAVAEVFYKNPDWDNNYESCWEIEPLIEEVVGGWNITLDNLDWSQADTYYVSISTGNRIYQTEVTATQVGQQINLAPDDTYFNVGIDASFIENVEELVLHYIDDAGYEMSAGDLEVGALIPAGTYHVQLNGWDASGNGYCLFKRNVQLSVTQNVISFAQDNMEKVTLNLNIPVDTNLNLNGIIPFPENDFYSIYWLEDSPYMDTIQSLYLTKDTYENISFEFNTPDDQWLYEIKTPQLIVDGNASTISIDVGADLQASIDLESLTFQPGQTLDTWRDIGVFDGIGNQYFIYDSEWNEIEGVIELNNSTLTEPIVLQITDSEITFPADVTGTFDMTYRVEDGPLSIAPATVQISIGSSGGSGVTGDMNGDGDVNIDDLSYMADFYGTNNVECDLNNDGIIDLYDLVMMSKNL